MDLKSIQTGDCFKIDGQRFLKCIEATPSTLTFETISIRDYDGSKHIFWEKDFMCNEINFRSIIKNSNVEEIAPELFDELVDMFKSTMIESTNLINSCAFIPLNAKFRLPTKGEFENLINNFSKWDNENKGLLVENKEGDTIFLPAAGYRFGLPSNNVGFEGYYWSSTMDERCSRNATCLVFNSREKYIGSYYLNYEHSVRLVSDEPFDGGVEFNGVWWKPENEEGHYTWEEAIKKW